MAEACQLHVVVRRHGGDLVPDLASGMGAKAASNSGPEYTVRVPVARSGMTR